MDPMSGVGVLPDGWLADRVERLILQATPYCNIDCDYCYLPDRSSTKRMPLDLVERVARNVLSSRRVRDELCVEWHAGEPLAVPVAYYEGAIAAIERWNVNGVAIQHALQTNATLVTQDWCRLFTTHKFLVGVSLDGPASLHDLHRKTRSGMGTHAAVMRGLDLLRAAGIDVHVIAVVTRDSVRHPDELFAFFAGAGLRNLAFNVDEIQGPHARSSLEGRGAETDYRRFLHRFLELNDEAGRPLRIREEVRTEKRILSGVRLDHGWVNHALAMINVDSRGNASTYSPELLGTKDASRSDFVIGNLSEQSLDELADGPRLRALAAEVEAGIAACRESCEYFRVCGGGAPSSKYFENGSMATTETLHCRLTRKVLTDVILDRIEHRKRAAKHAAPRG